MGFLQELKIALGTNTPAIRINTDEIDSCLDALNEQAARGGFRLRQWNRVQGVACSDPEDDFAERARPKAPPGVPPQPPTLLSTVLAYLEEVQETVKQKGVDACTPTLLVLQNLHLGFEGDRQAIVAAVQALAPQGKATGCLLVGLMPAEAKLPPEVAPLFKVLDHDLPDLQELASILGWIDRGPSAPALAEAEVAAITHAALGLTRLQADGAFAASALRNQGAIRAADVWREKAAILNRSGLVELHESSLTFADVGGLEGLKDFLRRITRPNKLAEKDPEAGYKGVMVVGPPGVGKSLMAYCLGQELGVPTLLFNPGNLMGGLVGDTERNTRQFFQIVKRMAPAVVVCDEVSQTLGNGDNSNSAVDNRLLGTFLTQMNDMMEPVFWFFTSNNIERMHEAFTRAERVDAVFHVGLPGPAQRAAVWKLYLKKFFPEITRAGHFSVELALEWLKAATPADVEQCADICLTLAPEARDAFRKAAQQASPELFKALDRHLVDDTDWTPAEIRACCRLANLLDLPLKEAAARVGHVCKGARGREVLKRLEDWAVDSGALDAETGVLCARDRPAAPPAPRGRKLQLPENPESN